MSYLPLIDLCKQYFRINAGDSDADITRKVHRGLEAVGAEPEATAPYLLHLLAADVDGGIPAAMPPEVVKRRTFEALRLLVLQSTTRRPLVIVFEDLHWVDKTTAEFATFLMEYIAGTRAMLVCTYRPEFVSTWSRKSYHSVITLTRLAPRESQQMLTFLLGTDQVQDELTTLMLEKAEGVPFFLEELAKSLQETDAIEMHQGQWRLKAETTALQVPDTVEELLMARIDRLPEGARSILQIGAVIGREFRWELLKEIAGLADQELMADRTTLTDAELIYERGLPPQTTCLFKHAFTQEAAYRSLLTTRRRDLHRRTALVLETLFSDRLEEHYGLLAHHYRAAEDLEKALDYHCRAAHACQRVYAVEEALEHYTRALEATTALRVEPTGGLSSGLHLQRGMVYAQTGAIAQAQHDFEAALEEARAAGNRADEVQALNELGFLLAGAADYRVAIPLFEAALPIAAALDDKASQVSILSRMSIVYTNRLQFAQALEHGYRALTLARTLEDTRALALAMDSLEVATAMIGDFATIDAIWGGMGGSRGVGELLSSHQAPWGGRGSPGSGQSHHRAIVHRL